MRNFIITFMWVLSWVLLWELFIVPLANRQENIKQVEQEQEEEFDIACFWCYTLVDGYCKDDTNWSKWCYNNFEWERPVNNYYD